MLTFSPGIAEQIRNSDAGWVVTGGSGWLGQATLEMMEQALGDSIGRVSIFGSSARELTLRSGRKVKCQALSSIASLSLHKPYYLHYAFLTKDRTWDRTPQEFIAGNEAITKLVTDAIRRTGTSGIILPSSGAVYDRDSHMIDRDIVANPYGVMKARDEQIFFALAEECEAVCVIARIFNLAGPFINKHDSYALSSMIKPVLAQQPIVIRASHRVVRSYVHVGDVINLCCAILFDRAMRNPFVFDTYGEKEVELNELAYDIIAALGHSSHPVNRPMVKNTQEDRYVGRDEMTRLMERYGLELRSLAQQIADTAEYLGKP